MLLYANGCSYTLGHGLTDRIVAPGDSWGTKEDYQYARSHSWPNRVAQLLDWQCVNDAMPGGSNDRVVRTTLSYLSQHRRYDTFVVIGWTKSFRRELYISEAKQYLHLGAMREHNISRIQALLHMDGNRAAQMTDSIMRYGWDVVESQIRYCTQVLLLSSYLRARGIPYLFINVLAEPTAIDLALGQSSLACDAHRLYQDIDWTDFLGYGSSNDRVFERFAADIPGHSKIDDHPNQLAHDQFARLVHGQVAARSQVD